MKKLLLIGFLLTMPTWASEITEDYFDIASNYCIQGNYTQAANYLDKILQLEPNNKNIQDLRNGLRQIIQGKNSSFIKSYAINKSITAKKSGDKQAELTALLGGNDYWAYYFTGVYYKENKDYNSAISYFVKSVNSKPTLTQCYLEIALCYFELKNWQQTLTYLNQYIKINPQDDLAYSLRAKTYMNMQNYDSALSDVLTASAMDNSAENRFLECKILYMSKKYSQALKKLLELEDELQTAEIYKYIGLCYARTGDLTNALMNLDKSIILFEDDKTVNDEYNSIKSRIENGT